MIYTDTDLILFSKLNQEKLAQVLNGLNARSALQMRHDLQVALTHYSKRNPAIKRLDHVQGSILLVCKMIEKAVREAYLLQKWRKIKAERPNMTMFEKAKKKGELKAMWEKFLKSTSY